ncbi:Stf0 family sulfotransferase [Rubellimicrobium rubrum]|uniref:Stf0 family sulfotransferase n=1 Tax=Rubellimicrobium rubrum TaxID=2585369 RepID=UPI00159BE6B7|nr:Stf0 family sulfotransferase [Rubellimicrobium rubrum]
MRSPVTSYVLCGTPRSGSTLLCGMLAASGVAGRPNSYFRPEDVVDWAAAWGVPQPHDLNSADFECAYLEAMRREGRAGTGVFGLRLMWDSVAEAGRRLNRALGADRDIGQAIEAAFGPTLYVHVSRKDKVAQAVSLVRAEQSGFWHLAADGTVLEGEETPRPVSYDRARLGEVTERLRTDDAAWVAFFQERRIRPLRLVYETASADPIAALAKVLAALGLDPELARHVAVPTARMADEVSREWTQRFHKESGGRGARV